MVTVNATVDNINNRVIDNNAPQLVVLDDTGRLARAEAITYINNLFDATEAGTVETTDELFGIKNGELFKFPIPPTFSNEGGVVSLTMFGAKPTESRAYNTPRLQQALDYCRDTHQDWYLPTGEYATGPLITWNSGRANGKFVIDNNSAYSYGLLTSPLTADITTLSLSFINNLTIERGTTQLNELAPYYQHAIFIANYADEDPIIRTGGNSVSWIESCIVNNPDGTFYPEFKNTKTVATWTSVDARAVKIREAVTLDNVTILVEDGSDANGGLASGFRVNRPNTIYRGCSVINEGTHEILQGFSTTGGGSLIRYENCLSAGLEINETNYGFNPATSDITLIGCTEIYSRRGQDGHGAKLVRIIGGSFPSGVGGHWIHDLRISGGTYISARPSSTCPIFASGSDVTVEDCTVHVAQDHDSVMKIRTDIFEMRGKFSLTNSKVTLDCTTDLTTHRAVMDLLIGASASGHDWGRRIFMPDHIQCTGNTIHVKGNSFTGRVYAVMFLGGNAGDDNPEGISGGGAMDFYGNSWISDNGLTDSGGGPKFAAYFYRNGGAWDHGDGYRVTLADFPTLSVFGYCNNNVPSVSTPRNDFFIDRVGHLKWWPNYGIFREARMNARTYEYKIGVGRNTSGTPNTTPVGDEMEIKSPLYFVRNANPASLAVGAASAPFTENCAGVKVGDGIHITAQTADAGWTCTGQCLTDGVISIVVVNHTVTNPNNMPATNFHITVFRN